MHEAFGDSQLQYLIYVDLPTQVYKSDYRIITKQFIDIMITASVAVSTRIYKLVRVDDYTSVIKDQARRDIWIDFVRNCSDFLHTIGNLSWLNFDNFEISVGY